LVGVDVEVEFDRNAGGRYNASVKPFSRYVANFTALLTLLLCIAAGGVFSMRVRRQLPISSHAIVAMMAIPTLYLVLFAVVFRRSPGSGVYR